MSTSLFFVRLNADVRQRIYDFIAPPLASNESAGIMLTCRQTYEEYQDNVIHRFQMGRLQLGNQMGVRLHLPKVPCGGPKRFEQLREVVVTVPLTRLIEQNEADTFHNDLHQRVLYPLMSWKFDRIEVNVLGSHVIGAWDRGAVSPLSEMSAQMEKYQRDFLSNTLEANFPFPDIGARGDNADQTKDGTVDWPHWDSCCQSPFQARRIVISWDFLHPNPGPPCYGQPMRLVADPSSKNGYTVATMMLEFWGSIGLRDPTRGLEVIPSRGRLDIVARNRWKLPENAREIEIENLDQVDGSEHDHDWL